MSVDLGGRYTKVDKHGGQTQFVQEWIFADVDNPGEEFIIPNATTHNQFRNNFPEYVGATPIGMTPERRDQADGVEKNDATREETHFDPQVVLRYRPADDISFYAKYAEAFKAGGFEVELKSTPQPEDFVFGPEDSTIYEIGARGSFWDGRARGGVTVFSNTVSNLQIGTTLSLAAVTATGVASQTVNAGELRVRGVEADAVAAVSDRLTMSFNGALYDGEMTNFKNAGCTDAEIIFGECDDPVEETIDRTGEKMPRLPGWVFTLGTDYWMPVLNDSFRMTFNGLFKYSDGYVTNIESFDKVIQMPAHTDLNISVGIGDLAETWELSLYGRNLLEPIVKYYPEFDVDPGPLLYETVSSNSFRTYGVQFRYYWN
jgi:iron complex outermembrane receptor protein